MIRIDIINDDTGEYPLIGNYNVWLYLPLDGGGWYETHARVERFHRSNGWDALAFLALTKLRDQVNEQWKGGERMSTIEKKNEVTIRFAASGQDRTEILRNVGQYLKQETQTHGLTMQSIELDGQEVSSDEVQEAANSNEL